MVQRGDTGRTSKFKRKESRSFGKLPLRDAKNDAPLCDSLRTTLRSLRLSFKKFAKFPITIQTFLKAFPHKCL
jgi:hypothetical protein